MLKKSKEYRYQQITNNGKTKNISIVKESYATRIERDFSYSMVKTVSTTSNGDNKYISGNGHNNFSSYKFTKNMSSSNVPKNNKQLKCPCPDGHKRYTTGTNNFKSVINTSFSRLTKTREGSIENSKMNKECKCGKDENHCTCNKNSLNLSRGGSENKFKSFSLKSIGNKCTCGKIFCTCGKSKEKKCICGKNIYICGKENIGLNCTCGKLKCTCLGRGRLICTCGKLRCTCKKEHSEDDKKYKKCICGKIPCVWGNNNKIGMNIKTITSRSEKKLEIP